MKKKTKSKYWLYSYFTEGMGHGINIIETSDMPTFPFQSVSAWLTEVSRMRSYVTTGMEITKKVYTELTKIPGALEVKDDTKPEDIYNWKKKVDMKGIKNGHSKN